MRRTLFTMACAAVIAGIASTATAASYKVVEVTGGGTITGSVSAGDNEPVVKSYTISKDPEICGKGTRDVEFVRINNGMIQDAVVFLEKVKQGKPFPEDLGSITLIQEGCKFIPPISVMQNKGDLIAVNDDPTLHNIHAYELIGKARRTVMNVSQPTKGDTVTKQIKVRKGNGLKIECDAHDFMHGFVFMAKNPYFAFVDENGAFRIDDVPPGTYKIKVWHGYLGEIDGGEVVVSAGGEASVDLSY